MVINSVEIANNLKRKKYAFNKSFNLIFSDKNSKGKTTLLRFILYGLGYNIPSTEGIGDFGKYEVTVKISNNNNEFILKRINTNIWLKKIMKKSHLYFLMNNMKCNLFYLTFKIC